MEMRSVELGNRLGAIREEAISLVAELLGAEPGRTVRFAGSDEIPDFVDIDNTHEIVRVDALFLDGGMPVISGSDGIERTVYEGMSTDDIMSLAECLERRSLGGAPKGNPDKPGGLWTPEYKGIKYGCYVEFDMKSGIVSQRYCLGGRLIGTSEVPAESWSGESVKEGLVKFLREHGRALRLGIDRCLIEYGGAEYPAFHCLDKGGLILLVASTSLRDALGDMADAEARCTDDAIFGYVDMDADTTDNGLVDRLEEAWGSDGIFDFAPTGSFD